MSEDVKTSMLEHSRAKVELYSKYLSIYLNILGRASSVKKIYLYDLMCGEGVYEDGSKGSPIEAIKKINEHYYANKNTCPDIDIWFNDKDKSGIDTNEYKIDRVKKCCQEIFTPLNVNINYTHGDYSEILPEVINKLKSLLESERALLFLDPYGYKDIQPEHIKKFLENEKTEMILFLPVSFMYRFANKSLSKEEFPGGQALKDFLSPLFGDKIQNVNSPNDFLEKIKQSFRKYLSYKIFVDPFTLERGKNNIFSLFFFTPHIKGFETMLKTKWKLDEERGQGFRLEKNYSLFSKIQISNYPQKLKEFIQKGNKTNRDLYRFGLDNGFLPMHTREVLSDWQKTNPSFKVYNKDDTEARKNSFYISYKYYQGSSDKIVTFIFEKDKNV